MQERTEPFDLAALNELLRVAPFHVLLDVRLIEAGPGRVKVALNPRPELVGNTLIGALHGGVTSGLVDLAGSIAVTTEVGYPCPTIDLRVDFLRPAFADKVLFAEGKVVRAGQSVAFTEIDVRDAEGRHIARGSAVYSTARFKNKEG